MRAVQEVPARNPSGSHSATSAVAPLSPPRSCHTQASPQSGAILAATVIPLDMTSSLRNTHPRPKVPTWAKNVLYGFFQIWCHEGSQAASRYHVPTPGPFTPLSSRVCRTQRFERCPGGQLLWSDGSVPRKTLCLSSHLPSGVPGATRPVIGPLGVSSPLFPPHCQQGSPTPLNCPPNMI